MEFRVNVRLEGIPPHAWGQDVAAMILGRSCAVHYVEEHTRHRERTRTYDLWAWCADPTKIPRRVWLTITDPDAEQPPTNIPLSQVRVHHDEPAGIKHGLTYKVLPHVAVVEDLSFLIDEGGQGGPPNRKHRRTFIWHYGEEDSQGEVRGRRDGGCGRQEHRRRDEYDDDQGGHHRRRRSTSTWGRVTRCRNGAADCYSSNIRNFNHNYGRSFRSRYLKWEPKNSSKHQKKDAKVAPAPAAPMGKRLPCIVEAEGNRKGMQLNMDVEVDMMMIEENVRATHLDNPINKITMDALQGLVEHGSMMIKKNGGSKNKGAAAQTMAA